MPVAKKQPNARPAPAATAGAAVAGCYCCRTDGLYYRLTTAPKSQGGGPLLARRLPDEPDWRPAVATTEDHIHRLLSFGSFTRLDDNDE